MIYKSRIMNDIGGSLIAEALPLSSKAGYDLKEFDVEKAVAAVQRWMVS